MATSPACHATRAGSAAPAAVASALAGSMTRNTCAISETVLMPYGSAQTSVRPGALGEPPGLEGVEQVADENRDRGARQHAAVDELRREAEHEPAERVDEEQLNEVVERQTEEPVDVAADNPSHGGENSSGRPS